MGYLSSCLPIKVQVPSLRNLVKNTLCATFMSALIAQTALAQENATLPNPSTAQRPWQVCNETSFILNIATASVNAQNPSSAIIARGWENLGAGKCLTMDVAKGTPRYVYARSSNIHQGGIREWKGRHPFCVAPMKKNFTAKTDQSCDAQDMRSADFLRVVPTEERTAFVEPANYGKRAQTAGLQRLLLDNNYSIKRVDGREGRRTSNTLNAFLKAEKLSSNLSLEAKLEALKQKAIKKQIDIGLTICNTAKSQIWSAVAYKEKHHWEARGWWPIKPNNCVRPYAGSLKGQQLHVYARLEVEGQTDRILALHATPTEESSNAKSSTKAFCISEASFSAVAHEFCQDQGYVSARFKAMPNIQTGATISLGDIDFKKRATNGLR